MTRPVRIGLIGVGGIGGMHLSAIAALARKGRVTLAAVADPLCAALPGKLALKLAGVPQFTDYRQMLDGGHALDAVVIATPIHFHLDMAREALSRGHFVYLEKPPVPLIQQLGELVSLDGEGRLAVAFQQIASGSLQRLKRWIINGRLGEIREIRAAGCWPRLGSYYSRASWAGKLTLGSHAVFDGPATNALSHVLHNIMYLAGESEERFSRPVEMRGELYRARPLDSYDTVCMRGRIQSGTAFVAAFSHATRDTLPWRVEVHGSKATATISEREPQPGGLSLQMPGAETLFTNAYGNFVDFASGKTGRPLTRASDTEGYVLTTNGALVSSDGIHDVPAPFATEFSQEGDNGYDITDAGKLMNRVLSEGLLFSGQGAPWARTTELVNTENLHSIPFAEIVEKARAGR